MIDKLINWSAGVLFSLLSMFGGDAGPLSFPGYAEGDFIYLAPRQGGIVENVEVRDGDDVKAGRTLFAMDARLQRQALAAAIARREAARARLEDSMKGRRPEEIAEIQAQLGMAKADLELAEVNFRRTKELLAMKAVPISRYDRDRALLNVAREKLRQIEAAMAVAKLPQRQDAIKAARENLRAAEAAVKQAQIDLEDRIVAAPADGRVEKVFARRGEYIAAGTPVLSFLPPGNVKIRFFIPERLRAALRIGGQVRVSCDGCREGLKATVKYISASAEHTPPVIFSLDERAKLVFAVDAYLAEPWRLLPGQPVDVRLDKP